MQSWKTYLSPRFLVLYCGICGLIIPFWVMQNYAATGDYRAIFIIMLILVGFTLGINEQWRNAVDTDELYQELEHQELEKPPQLLLDELSPGLRRLVNARRQGSGTMGRTHFSPYLIGALVMLGLIGTFLGLVDTLGGTRAALQTTADVEALRGSLLAPIAGLARAFGTSVSGVAASVLLGLAATLTRREDINLQHAVSNFVNGSLQALDPIARQTTAMERLLDQGIIFQPMVARFHEAVVALMDMQEETRKNQEYLIHQIGNVIGGRMETICNELSASVRRFGENVEPAVGRVMAQATDFVGTAGRELLEKVEQNLSEGAVSDQKRKAELMKLLEDERSNRSKQELEHFERLTGHAKRLTDSLQSHVESVGKQYAVFIKHIEEQANRFDNSWREDVEGRRKETEHQHQVFDEHLEKVRYKFAEQSELLARRHHEVLDRLNQQYQDTVERFSKHSSSFAEHAAQALGEMQVKYAQIVDQHQADRQQLREAWGSEQGRQQQQFNTMLERMRQDLEDRRRADQDLLASLSAWAQQMTKRIEVSVEDKAGVWDQQFQKLITALGETAEAMRLGDRSRIKEFKEIVQVVSEADKNRADEMQRLIAALYQPSSQPNWARS